MKQLSFYAPVAQSGSKNYLPLSDINLRTIMFLFLMLSGISKVNAQYCTPMYTTGCGSGVLINTFQLAGVSGTKINDSNSLCASGSYSDSSLVSMVILNQGGTYSAMISTFTTPACVQLFIDFNDNFTFETSETVGGQNGVAFDPALSTVWVNIPATAATGTHRMRVVIGSGSSFPMLDPCPGSSVSMGEVHDYSVNIAGSSSCAMVTGLTAASITTSSAVISWTAAAGSAGYQYVVNTTAGSPSGSGTATATTTFSPAGLSPATTYYAHVRDSCSVSNLSAWATIPFTTLSAGSCDTVAGLTVSGVTNTSATISWTAVSGSAGYQYVINTVAANPSGSGTPALSTSTTPTGLTASTTYYAHVRDSCGAGNLSPWTTISFTTLAAPPSCAPVTGLATSGITNHAVTIHWTAVTGSTGYKYVVNTTAADPAVAGTFTGSTSVNVTALPPSTNYYAHVRDSCGAGNVSSWVTISFATLSSAGIAEIDNNEGSIVAFPNPVNNILTLHANNLQGSANVQLMDISGKAILVSAMDAQSIQLDMSGLASGIYMIRYIDALHNETIKIVKE